MSVTEGRFNTIATILGPLLIAGLVWALHADQKIAMQEQAKFTAETYVTKSWFESSLKETNNRLDNLSSAVGSVQRDVATIEGQMQSTVRMKGNN